MRLFVDFHLKSSFPSTITIGGLAGCQGAALLEEDDFARGVDRCEEELDVEDDSEELLDELSDHVVGLPLCDRRDRSLSLRLFFCSLRVLFLSCSLKWRLTSSSHDRMVFQN